MAEVQVQDLRIAYGGITAVDGVSLDFPEGQLFGLLGPSGSGKTTLLRAIAGFVRPQSGEIRIGGKSVAAIPVEKREVGMMFQNYALFPNMSVAENIGFGLRVRKIGAGEVRRRVADALDLVQLGKFGERRPRELSGGQRQRVALARAIVTRPRVLLLDEPLSALDKSLRVDMQIELRRIQREVGITTIFVTHDQEEALTLSDQIGILAEGRLVQAGPPRDVYNAPINRFAATFLGEANFLSGVAEAGGVRLSDGALAPWPNTGRRATLAIRPEAATLSGEKPGASDTRTVLPGAMTEVVFSGPMATAFLQVEGSVFKVLLKSAELNGLPLTGEVWVSWRNADALAFDD
jgi:ABC-type Fe3+/spermidine/putrescine transport system ATPase subunit